MWETDNIKSRKKFSKKGDDIAPTKQKHVIKRRKEGKKKGKEEENSLKLKIR